MTRAAGAVLLCVGVLLPAPAAAQDNAPGPPGPYVLDLRGGVSSLAVDAEMAAALPAGASPPTRGFGGELGFHVYPLSLGPARIGIGASLIRIVSKLAPAAAQPETSSSEAVDALPGLSTTFSALVPQISFNFGSADGWSYLSAGIGRASVRSEFLPAPGGTTTTAGSVGQPEATTATVKGSGTLNTINVGGGARWFTKRHMAVSFDVRFHRLPPGSLERVSATTLVMGIGGISIR